MVFYKLFHSQQCLADKSKAGASGPSARSHQVRFLYFLVTRTIRLPSMYYLTDIDLEEVVLSTDDGISFM